MQKVNSEHQNWQIAGVSVSMFCPYYLPLSHFQLLVRSEVSKLNIKMNQ